MLIYRILNLIDNKCYIGKTIYNTFFERYGSKWYQSTHNNYLKDAANKYGYENFAIQILEENIESIDLLNEKEKFYIKKYNCLAPNGYNFLEGGEGGPLHPETKRKISEKRAREFFFVDFQGNEFHVINLKKFCEDRGLLYAAMKNMARGKTLTSSGFALKGTNPSIIKNPNIIYKLKDLRTGEILEFSNMNKFAREHGLLQPMLQKLLAGKASLPYNNYANIEMDLSLWSKKLFFSKTKLKSPSGEIKEVGFSAENFAKNNPPLRKEDVYALVNKKAIERKGWTLAATTKKDIENFRENKKNTAIYIFKENEKEILVKNLTKFCEDNNLIYREMMYLVRGRPSIYKNYTFVKKVKGNKNTKYNQIKIQNLETKEILTAKNANDLWKQVRGKIAKNKMFTLIRKKIDKIGDWILI